MEDNYYSKYLKYKLKYLKLKKQLGGYKCENFEQSRCNITPGCKWSGKTCIKKSCSGRSELDCAATVGCENKYVYIFPKESWKKVAPTQTCIKKSCKGRTQLDCNATAGCEFKNGNCQ
jgi:hypothetical protein